MMQRIRAKLDEISFSLLSPMRTYKQNATEDAPLLENMMEAVLGCIEYDSFYAQDGALKFGQVVKVQHLLEAMNLVIEQDKTERLVS